MNIRNEIESDWPSIWKLNAGAFKTEAEAALVDLLRKNGNPFVSIVAEEDQTIVGHILFTPVTLTGHPNLKMMGLAPMAVAPQYQKKGIGSSLVRSGLKECEKLEMGAVVVLGHPKYYPRFGFLPASNFQIKSEYEVPDDVFMVKELRPGYLKGKFGTIKYQEEFGKL